MIWFNCLGKDTSGSIDGRGTGTIQERYLECHCNNQARADNGFDLDSSREGSGMESRYGSVLKIQRTRMAEKSNGVWERNNKDNRDSSSKNCGLRPWEDEVTTDEMGKTVRRLRWRGWKSSLVLDVFIWRCLFNFHMDVSRRLWI